MLAPESCGLPKETFDVPAFVMTMNCGTLRVPLTRCPKLIWAGETVKPVTGPDNERRWAATSGEASIRCGKADATIAITGSARQSPQQDLEPEDSIHSVSGEFFSVVLLLWDQNFPADHLEVVQLTSALSPSFADGLPASGCVYSRAHGSARVSLPCCGPSLA
jgi:hypothetical protein